MTKTPLGVTAIALFVSALGSSSATASPLTWTFQNMPFIGGGTASGSFVFDATATAFSSIDIPVTAAGGLPATTYLFLDPGTASNASQLFTVDSNAADLTGSHRLLLGFVNPLTNAGGADFTNDFGSGEGSCVNSNCSSVTGLVDFSSGVTVSAGVPEPATLSLVAFALLALFATKHLGLKSGSK